MRDVWGPASYALQGSIWQWRKFELLDWLRPLELLLRRMLLIEAFALAGSQTLPPPSERKAKCESKTNDASAVTSNAAAAESGPAAATPVFDPARPETWRVSFIALPAQSRSGPRHRLPPVQPNRQFREEVWAKRYRRKLVAALPLARRLEAAIRVINNPLPFVRRLAFKLRRGHTLSATRLVIPRSRRFRFATDALAASGNRAAELSGAWWGSG